VTIPVQHNAAGREYPVARTITVIAVTFTRGAGLDESDPVREVIRYFDIDGNLLAEHDIFLEEKA
jgi:hypothetical protein